jgi:hypothetical protein
LWYILWIKHGGLEALCLYSNPKEISDFEEDLEDEIQGTTQVEEEHDFNLDDVFKETPQGSTPGFIALRMKKLLDGIQEESTSRDTLLMHHTNTILEKLYIDVKKWKTENATDSLHPEKTFEPRMDITSKSIKRTRDYIEIYMRKKEGREVTTPMIE